jgi:hypothetical protein
VKTLETIAGIEAAGSDEGHRIVHTLVFAEKGISTATTYGLTDLSE